MYTMGIPLSDERFTIFAKVHASEIMHLQGHLSSYIFPTLQTYAYTQTNNTYTHYLRHTFKNLIRRRQDCEISRMG